MRRLAALLVVTAAAPALGACGGSGAGDRAARSGPPVRLTVTAPADLASTRATSITVAGTVEPAGATVRVLGRPAELVGREFSADVDLDPGSNVIDVVATAPDRAPALTAVRVTREMPVEVPDLDGLGEDDARAKVEAVGLKLEAREAGGLFEPLLPGEPAVCEQDPPAGADAMRGSVVHVRLAKSC